MTDHTKSVARRLRMAIPLLGIAVGVFLLVGCVYLPIPEHGTDWSRKDFRPLLDANNKSSPIRIGRITRTQLIKLLGPPAFELSDRRQLIYRYDVERDVVLWPLCFIVQPGYRDSYAVAFTFDVRDILSGWETAHEKAHYIGGGAIQTPYLDYPDATDAFRPKRPEDGAGTSTQPATKP
ncbi:MAG: hypothetical protein JWL69_3052 [Phycisphaerales bacterium]|nr:hypothetical protein [Phycisphaerales bacterium]